jgi:hypothetical protein
MLRNFTGLAWSCSWPRDAAVRVEVRATSTRRRSWQFGALAPGLGPCRCSDFSARVRRRCAPHRAG